MTLNPDTDSDPACWFDDELGRVLGTQAGSLKVRRLNSAAEVADGTTKLQVNDQQGIPRAFILCSAAAAPDMVQRGCDRSRLAKAALGPELGTRILEPLDAGRMHGRSYAIFPYCTPLSGFQPIWMLQRLRVRPALLDWLWQSTRHTANRLPAESRTQQFEERIRHIAGLHTLPRSLRSAAEQAAKRLESGDWNPKPVLMHGDLWKANLLVRPAGPGTALPWEDRIVVIDWPGAELEGYALYDLVRLARSFQLSRRALRREVARHCQVLQCEVTDAMSYLIAALGHIALTLEHFPLDRYLRLADTCHATLNEALT